MTSVGSTGGATIGGGGAVAKLGEGRAPVGERLLATLFLAGLLHAIVILGLTFTGSERPGLQTPALEVLLVTDEVPPAKHNDRAVYLAQRTQLGSGNTADSVPAGSPAPRAPTDGSTASQAGSAAEEQQRPEEQSVLVTSGAAADIRYIGDSTARPAAEREPEREAGAEGPPRSGRGDAEELTLRGETRADLRIAPDTREARLAPYVAAWKHKVERVGTLNFPSAARSQGLSGSPVVEVTINADGRLVSSRVQRSSGYAAIDEAALGILKLASPFDPFPPELAADYATLRFAYQWEFVGGKLQSGNVTASPDDAHRP